MAKLKVKKFGKPDELRKFDRGKLSLLTFSGGTVGRAVFEPGWKWSKHVKPIAKTKSCEAPHFQYHATGVLHVAMDDGTEMDIGPGEVSWVPPGHDAWVVGVEPVTLIDFQGMVDYAKSSAKK
jgi:3',5'-cyclic AMP phosphodiesterase CpdA